MFITENLPSKVESNSYSHTMDKIHYLFETFAGVAIPDSGKQWNYRIWSETHQPKDHLVKRWSWIFGHVIQKGDKMLKGDTRKANAKSNTVGLIQTSWES